MLREYVDKELLIEIINIDLSIKDKQHLIDIINGMPILKSVCRPRLNGVKIDMEKESGEEHE